MAAAAITARGYAHTDLSNIADETLRARILGLGLRFGGPVPNLLDYTGETFQGDPAGQHSSWKALNQFALDCSAANGGAGVVGVAAFGSWIHDGPTIRFLPGAGASHWPAALDSRRSNVTGSLGCNVIRPMCEHIGEPMFGVLSNTHYHWNLYAADMLAQAEAALDETGAGELPGYAPAYAADFTRNVLGQKIGPNAKANVDYFTLIGSVIGFRTGAFLREAVTSEEPWAADFSNQVGASCGGMMLRLKGFCTDRDVCIGRLSISAEAAESGSHGIVTDFGPQNWIEAQVGPAGYDPDVSGPWLKKLMRYRRANGIHGELRHRAVGVGWRYKARGCHTVFDFAAGPAPQAWLDANADGGQGPQSPDGQDNGKFNQGNFEGGVEDVTTFVHVDETAFLFRNLFACRHHAANPTANKDNPGIGDIGPFIYIGSDGAKAGILSKQGAWKASADYGSWNQWTLEMAQICGPVFVNTANEPFGHHIFGNGGRVANWYNGDKHAAPSIDDPAYGYAFQNHAPATRLTVQTMELNTGSYGSTWLFYQANPGLLHVHGNSYVGWNDPDDEGSGPGASWSHTSNIQPFGDPCGSIWPGAATDDPDDDDDDDDGEDGQ